MEVKTCAACKVAKPIGDFAIRVRSKDGRYYYCKACDRLKAAKWRAANRARHRAATQKWREKNPEANRIAVANWNAKNPARKLALSRAAYERDPARAAANMRKWVNDNRPVKRAIAAKRKAAQVSATPAWLTAIHLAQIQEHYDVAEALNTQTGVVHHVDHIHPLQGGTFNGLHVPWNLQVLPAIDNLRKGTHVPPSHLHLAFHV